jgi:steroid 5-alpha reductase family enzyme
MSLATLLQAAAIQLAALSLIMTGAWWVQRRTRNSGFVDAVWTFGLGLVGIASALAPLDGSDTTVRQMVVAIIMLAWSVRLGFHIVRRSLGRADDPRYAALIRRWGSHASVQMFILLQKQALVTLPMASAVFVAAHNPAPFGRMLDFLGLMVVILGIVGETVSDRQLQSWIEARQEKDRIFDDGLWRLSRHPNYFFEWVFWLAFPFFAVDLDGGYESGWLALVAPVCMYLLLVHITGIPPLEHHMVAKHGDAYRNYQARTRAFFPLPKQPRGEAE